MEDLQTYLIFLIVLLISYIYVKGCKKKKVNLPPGPFSLPILGTLPWLGTDLREPLEGFRKKYGDVFTVYLGTRRTIMLSSYDVIKEAFVKKGNQFLDRPCDMLFIKEMTLGYGLISASGNHWKHQRKFGQNVFREFGVGKSAIEGKILNEISFFLSSIEQFKSEPFNPNDVLLCSVSNIINTVTYGSRFDYDDPDFRHLLDINSQGIQTLSNANVITALPFLLHLPGDPFKIKWLKNCCVPFSRQFDQKQVVRHKETMTPGLVRDFIDAFLIEMEKEKDNKDTTFTNQQLLQFIADLFGAGAETSSTTLKWALIYLLHYPEFQARAQREIASVIGHQRRPSMADKAQLPYTEAFILETQRLADIVPIGLPHCTTEDVVLRGYDIPKGTTVMSNLYSVHRDARVWEKPYEFNPDRFLDEEGKVCKRDLIIPFSMGKRVCLGESLARMELFLFLTSMLQRFNFSNPPGQPLPNFVGKLGLTHFPEPFQVIATPLC